MSLPPTFSSPVLSPLVSADGGMLFSYQNLSPFLRIWNCCPRRQPKVGPTTAPDRGRSARPPTSRSMSSTWAYTERRKNTW